MRVGNYQLYVDNFRPTCSYSGSTTMYGICGMKIIFFFNFRPTFPYSGNINVYGTRESEIINFILLTSGQLVYNQVIQLYVKHVEGKLSTLYCSLPAN
jgi:hypothetical protein